MASAAVAVPGASTLTRPLPWRSSSGVSQGKALTVPGACFLCAGLPGEGCGHTPQSCSLRAKAPWRKAVVSLRASWTPCVLSSLHQPAESRGRAAGALQGRATKVALPKRVLGGQHCPALGNWQAREHTSFSVMKRRKKKPTLKSRTKISCLKRYSML